MEVASHHLNIHRRIFPFFIIVIRILLYKKEEKKKLSTFFLHILITCSALLLCMRKGDESRDEEKVDNLFILFPVLKEKDISRKAQ